MIVVSATSSGTPSQADPYATVTADVQGGLIYFSAPDPADRAYPIASVTRMGDGKVLHPFNGWQFSDDADVNSIGIFDDSYVGGVQQDYQIRYDMSAFDNVAPVTVLNMLSPNITGDEHRR